jgi:hypothetical protein
MNQPSCYKYTKLSVDRIHNNELKWKVEWRSAFEKLRKQSAKADEAEC